MKILFNKYPSLSTWDYFKYAQRLTRSIDFLHVRHPVNNDPTDLLPGLLHLLRIFQARLMSNLEPLAMVGLACTDMVLVMEWLQFNVD